MIQRLISIFKLFMKRIALIYHLWHIHELVIMSWSEIALTRTLVCYLRPQYTLLHFLYLIK